MNIPTAHLITIQQSVPVRTFYLQALFLTKPLSWGGLHAWNHLPK